MRQVPGHGPTTDQSDVETKLAVSDGLADVERDPIRRRQEPRQAQQKHMGGPYPLHTGTADGSPTDGARDAKPQELAHGYNVGIFTIRRGQCAA
jgi:hypothetical protein